MSRANIAMIQDIYAAIARRDFEAAVAHMTAEVDWRINGRPLLLSNNPQLEDPEK